MQYFVDLSWLKIWEFDLHIYFSHPKFNEPIGIASIAIVVCRCGCAEWLMPEPHPCTICIEVVSRFSPYQTYALPFYYFKCKYESRVKWFWRWWIANFQAWNNILVCLHWHTQLNTDQKSSLNSVAGLSWLFEKMKWSTNYSSFYIHTESILQSNPNAD